MGTSQPPQDPIAFRAHDHSGCVADVAAQVDALCAERGLRLTPQRRRVLELLLEAHRALGAYDILARLQEEGMAAHPPVAYRALDFLVENGFAHRIERLNAFIACGHPGEGHAPAFLICKSCDTIAETEGGPCTDAIIQAAEGAGFAIQTAAVEVVGLCPKCQTADA